MLFSGLFCGNYCCTYHRCAGRTDQIHGLSVVHRYLVLSGLCTDGAYGLGRRLAGGRWCTGFCGEPLCISTRRLRVSWCLHIGTAPVAGKTATKPHSLPMVFTGTAILYIGWFGFNAGSAGKPDGIAALAFLNTVIAVAAGVLAWVIAEWCMRGKPSLLGACSGCIGGLVGITPRPGRWASRGR